jgi:hypothetical protein
MIVASPVPAALMQTVAIAMVIPSGAHPLISVMRRPFPLAMPPRPVAATPIVIARCPYVVWTGSYSDWPFDHRRRRTDRNPRVVMSASASSQQRKYNQHTGQSNLSKYFHPYTSLDRIGNIARPLPSRNHRIQNAIGILSPCGGSRRYTVARWPWVSHDITGNNPR